VADELDFLAGHSVEQIAVWGPFQLVLDSREPGIHVDVESPCELLLGTRHVKINFFAGGDRAEAAALLQLLWKQVSAARIEKGTLCLSFDGGSELCVPPSKEGESWSVVGDGRQIICMPGGDVVST
jgi:hypothetical protein